MSCSQKPVCIIHPDNAIQDIKLPGCKLTILKVDDLQHGAGFLDVIQAKIAVGDDPFAAVLVKIFPGRVVDLVHFVNLIGGEKMFEVVEMRLKLFKFLAQEVIVLLVSGLRVMKGTQPGTHPEPIDA